jgi:hypothetical protein
LVRGSNAWTAGFFEREEQVFHLIERIVFPLGLRVDESMPDGLTQAWSAYELATLKLFRIRHGGRAASHRSR